MIDHASEIPVTPPLIGAMLNASDPAALVEAYRSAVSIGRADLAAQVARLAAYLGQQSKAVAARCDYELGRVHESAYDQVWAEHDAAIDDLNTLEAVPELKAAIEAMPREEIDEIWAEHAFTTIGGDDEEDE
ncbi:MAG: hypothetical protein K2X54_19185 [Methylobacterium organophilum]|nr:hypothetical protein [Methylobacterium organophilum]